MRSISGNMGVEIELMPSRGALCSEGRNALDVLVTLRAPGQSNRYARERPPIGIALVVDRSGSMDGAPLEAARRCCELAVRRLRDDDILALVQFDDTAEVIREAAALDDRARILAQINNIKHGANTNLYAGWLAGAQQLAPHALDVRFQRVMLLSDGYAGVGVTNSFRILEEVGALVKEGVTTSTFGLGDDFDYFLLSQMAAQGHGNHYYAATADDLFSCFKRELDGVLSLWRRNVVLKVLPANGVSVTLMNPHIQDLALRQPLGLRTWRLPDIALGSETCVVVRLGIHSERPDHPEGLFDVVVSGRDSEGVLHEARQAMAPLPVLSPDAFRTVAKRPWVATRALEMDAAVMLFECRRFAHSDKWESVDAILREARLLFETHPELSAITASMSRLAARREKSVFVREAFYTSRSLSLPLR